jgi:hypothetical protein
MSARWGSASEHQRTMVRNPDMRRGRRWCPWCPTRNRATHVGLANGIGLMSGCEWHVRQWVKDWRAPYRRAGRNG